MAIPIIPIIMAVASLAGGITKAVSSVKDAKAQAKVEKIQAEEQINEKARQAAKLMSQQKTSFLKGGVYFDGTPEAIINETYDFMENDINTLKKNANTNIKNIMRQGKTAFATSLIESVTSGISGFGAGQASGFTGQSDGIMDKLRNVFGRQNNLVGGFGPVDGTNNKIA